MTTRVVSTGIASSTPAVVCTPPQDSATRIAAVCRMPTRSPTRFSTWPSGTSSNDDEEADHQGLAHQWWNESESFGHRTLPSVVALAGSLAAMWPIGAAQLWRIVAAASANIARACPSPSSISTARSRIATRCFRWCCGSSRGRPVAPAAAVARGAGRQFASCSIAIAPRSSNRCCAPRCAARRAASCTRPARAFVTRHHRATAVSRMRWPRSAVIARRDTHLVLMSASVDFYVPEFGRQLGFDQVISTGVAWNGELLDGTLTTPNRRGDEKARCLRALVAERNDERNLRVRQRRFGSAAPATRATRPAGERQSHRAPRSSRDRRAPRRMDLNPT